MPIWSPNIHIITDNGTQFIGRKLREFYVDSGIKLSFASVYHPQANGQVEVTNRTIVSILKERWVNTRASGQIKSPKQYKHTA